MMVENGLYVIKRELLEIINRLGGDCDIINGNKQQNTEIGRASWRERV